MHRALLSTRAGIPLPMMTGEAHDTATPTQSVQDRTRSRNAGKKPKGASLEAICADTGWQRHSARAALSGLRKAGHTIERQPSNGKGGGAIYRISSTTEANE